MPASPDPLSSLLAEWQHTPAPDPDFAANVRRRLSAPPARLGLLGLLCAFFAIPATPSLRLASALTLLVAISAGVQTGLHAQRTKAFDLGANHYVLTIDPLLQIQSGSALPADHQHR